MLENALRICEAKFGVLFRIDDDVTNPVAMLNLPPAFDEYLRQRERRKPRPGSDLDILCKSKQAVRNLPAGSSAIHRKADRSAPKLCGAGRHRYREYAPRQRAARIVAAADRHSRGVGRHFEFTWSTGTGISNYADKCGANLRSQIRHAVSLRRRGFLPCRGKRHARCV